MQIPRRTFLRGLGTAIALPTLEAMIPARALAAFQRVHVAAGASLVVSLTISPSQLAVLHVPDLGGAASTWMADQVTMRLTVGGQQPGMAVRAPSNVVDAMFVVAGAAVPLDSCSQPAASAAAARKRSSDAAKSSR